MISSRKSNIGKYVKSLFLFDANICYVQFVFLFNYIENVFMLR